MRTGWIGRIIEILFYTAAMGAFAIFMAWSFEGAGPRETASLFVSPTEVPQGGELTVEVKAKVEKDCRVTIERAVIDVEGTVRPSVPIESFEEAGTAALIATSFVPSAATPGPAFYRVILRWQCNPLQEFWPRIEQLPDLPFLITEAPAQ